MRTACSSASDICLEDQRVTLTGTDVMNALEALGLDKMSCRCVPRLSVHECVSFAPGKL